MKIELRGVARVVLAALFGVAGVAHFTNTAAFVSIVPPQLPWPEGLVWVSGVFELLGAAGLLVPAGRPIARWGLIALLIAVFPANLYMAIAQVWPAGVAPQAPWMLWARLPMQAVLIGLVWWAGRDAVIRDVKP